MTQHHVGYEAGLLQLQRDARHLLRIDDSGLRFAQVMMDRRRDGPMRLVHDVPHARQRPILALRDEDDFVAGQGAEMTRQMQILAREVLVDEEDFHNKNFTMYAQKNVKSYRDSSRTLKKSA